MRGGCNVLDKMTLCGVVTRLSLTPRGMGDGKYPLCIRVKFLKKTRTEIQVGNRMPQFPERSSSKDTSRRVPVNMVLSQVSHSNFEIKSSH